MAGVNVFLIVVMAIGIALSARSLTVPPAKRRDMVAKRSRRRWAPRSADHYRRRAIKSWTGLLLLSALLIAPLIVRGGAATTAVRDLTTTFAIVLIGLAIVGLITDKRLRMDEELGINHHQDPLQRAPLW